MKAIKAGVDPVRGNPNDPNDKGRIEKEPENPGVPSGDIPNGVPLDQPKEEAKSGEMDEDEMMKRLMNLDVNPSSDPQPSDP